MGVVVRGSSRQPRDCQESTLTVVLVMLGTGFYPLWPPVLVSIRLSLVPGSKLMLVTPQPYFTLVQPIAALEKVEVGGGKSLLSLQEALPPARL